MRPIATACAVFILLCAAAFAYASLSGSPDVDKAPRKQKALTISGSVENLQPGLPTKLNAVVRNRSRYQLRLRSVQAKVGDASPACPRSMLLTRAVRLRGVLRPHQSRTVPLSVTLVATAPDACQNATFPLRFRARAARMTSKR